MLIVILSVDFGLERETCGAVAEEGGKDEDRRLDYLE